MSLQDYLSVLARRWWVIATVTALGVVAALGLTLITTPTYSAGASVYVAVVGSANPGDLQVGNVFAVQRAATYAQLVRTPAVLERAASSLRDGTDVEALKATITASVRVDTSIIDIFAMGTDPQIVANHANAVASALAVAVEELDGPASASLIALDIVDRALPPEVSDSPRLRPNLLVGFIVGAVLGVGYVVLRFALDTRIHALIDLPRRAAIGTVTTIPKRGVPLNRRGAVSDARLEGFRVLRANLLFGIEVGRTVAIAGVDRNADSRGVADKFAEVLGELELSVVVVDAVFERDRAGKVRDRMPAGHGLAQVLAREASLEDVVIKDTESGVDYISAGTPTPVSAQLIGSALMGTLLADLGDRYDYVLLICPAVVSHSEASVAAALVESALLVVEAGDTTRSDFRLALDRLAGVGVRSVNVVLDHVLPRDLGRTGGTLPGASI